MSFYPAEFILEFVLTSSDLTTGGAILATANAGDIYIKDIVLRTDSTGLAGGTAFQIYTDSTIGNPVIFSETFGNLGANQTVSLAYSAAATTVVARDKHIKVKSTVGAGTGAGKVYVTIVCQRASVNGTIYS